MRGEIDSHSECNEESQNRGNFTNHAIFRVAQDDENGDFLRHTEELHLQSAECRLKTQAVCRTFQPNEDTFNANVVIGNKELHNREDCTNNAIIRGLNNCSLQKDGKNSCRLMRGDVRKTTRKVAFTLAEVLITLGIVGVVAALTLPSLIHRYQSEVLKNQFKKSYSILSQATLSAREELGVENFASYCVSNNGTSYVNSIECRNAILKQLKDFGKMCRYNANKTYTYSKTQTNARVDIGATAYPAYKLPDGSCVGVTVNSYRIGLSVDVNGSEKGPNALGHDIFSFWANDSGALVPIKMTEFKDDDQLQEMISKCDSDDYTHSACASGAQQKGYPCTKKSNQKGNGLGCSWYALNDVSPDDSSKGYWESLPR